MLVLVLVFMMVLYQNPQFESDHKTLVANY